MTSQRGISQVGRRLFLRGAAGIVVGLPVLETFVPRTARADDNVFRFAVFLRQGNGCQQGMYNNEPDRFWPTKLGALTTASMKADGDQAVNVLADYASKLLIVRGVEKKNITDMDVSIGCGHSGGGAECLTAAKVLPNPSAVQDALSLGESIDNRIVRELQPNGTEPLTLRSSSRSGYLDDVLSYRAPKDRRTAEANPYNAYKALFGAPDQSAQQAAALAARRKSVNDFVRAEMATILANPKLSANDKYRLQQHQQAIRDLETKMSCQLPSSMLNPMSQITDKQAVDQTNVEQITQMQAQVIALAFSCGTVRAATLQIGNGNDQTQYVINGKQYDIFHHISHRIQGDGSSGDPIPNADVLHHDIDKHIGGYFKYLLDQLASYTTTTGTLLDEGVAVWLNDLATGPPHGSQNIPYICAGGCGGKLNTGVFIDAADQPNGKYVANNKLFNSIGAAVGCKNASGAPLDDFGDASLDKGNIPAMVKSA